MTDRRDEYADPLRQMALLAGAASAACMTNNTRGLREVLPLLTALHGMPTYQRMMKELRETDPRRDPEVEVRNARNAMLARQGLKPEEGR